MEDLIVLEMQACLWAWQEKNFGRTEADIERFALGAIEEVGEWIAAQSLREENDAVGDILIFLCQLHSAIKVPFVIPNSTTNPPTKLRAMGKLAQAVLKYRQDIRDVSKEDLLKACVDLIDVIRLEASYKRSLFLDTAEEVLKRDWTKYPLNGRTE